jgi:hypothetical protein
MQVMLECCDSHLRSVDSERESDHSVDDVAVIDTLVTSDNEAVAASAENVFVGRYVKLQRA